MPAGSGLERGQRLKERVSLYSEERPLNKSREGQELAVSCSPNSRQTDPKSQRHLCEQGRVGGCQILSAPVAAGCVAARLPVLASSRVPAPRPLTHCHRRCLPSALQSKPQGAISDAESSSDAPHRPSFPIPVLCSFSSASVLWSILTALWSPMESSASSSPPMVPPASCRERALSRASVWMGREDGDTLARHRPRNCAGG